MCEDATNYTLMQPETIEEGKKKEKESIR